jgi:hypothetical protein
MRHHSIVVRLGPGDTASVTASRSDTYATEINFVDGDYRLGYGLGQALDQLRELGFRPGETGIDLAILAAAITAADTRISRGLDAQDGWTREIDLHLPVQNPVDRFGAANRYYLELPHRRPLGHIFPSEATRYCRASLGSSEAAVGISDDDLSFFGRARQLHRRN